MDRARQKAALFRKGTADAVTQELTLRAPIDGEVIARNMNPGAEVQGQYAGGGAVELFTIGELDSVWVLADVFEMDLGRVRKGAPVTLKVVAYPDHVFSGTVDYISDSLDPIARTARVRCSVANPTRELKPEMYATVSIGVAGSHVPALARSAVLHIADQTVVFVETGNAPDGRLKFARRVVAVDETEGASYVPILRGVVGGRARGQQGRHPAVRHALGTYVFIQRVVRFVLRMPAFVGVIALLIVALGLYSYKQLDIEAYPNPVPPMIEIITQPGGWSAEEVERYVTIPLEIGLNGMIDLDHIRSQSLFGLSDVKCYFNWNVDYATAQQRVLNRLSFITLPPGMTPQLSPWNAIGEVYRYVVRGDGYTLADLKTAQDWILERQFRQVPGVIDVVGFGGQTKEYHVEVDPFRLKGHGLTLAQVENAINNSNTNVGGQHLTLGEQSFNVRGIGLIRSLSDIREIVDRRAEGHAGARARRRRGVDRQRAAPGHRRQGPGSPTSCRARC